MKKELTKEDLIAYLKTLPESLWLGLPGAGTVVRDAAIGTIKEQGYSCTLRNSFSGSLHCLMNWSGTPQGHSFWQKLYEKLPENVGIDIPDPSIVAPNPFRVGMKVLLKTIDELRATPGVTESGAGLSGYSYSFVAPMYPLAGTVVTVVRVDDDGSAKIRSPDTGAWWLEPYMVKAFDVDALSPITDPADPRAKALMGKKVYYSGEATAFLTGLKVGERRGFGVSVHAGDSPVGWFESVRPFEKIEEEPAVEVTMADVCKAFGKNVKIKKA